MKELSKNNKKKLEEVTNELRHLPKENVFVHFMDIIFLELFKIKKAKKQGVKKIQQAY